MTTNESAAHALQPRWMTVAGWVLTFLPVPLLALSASMKFLQPAEAVEGTVKLGYPQSTMIPIGIAEVVSTVLFLFPRTAVLGAVLLTGYMGGAIATHVRVGEPFVPAALIGIVAWLALFLRDARLRSLLPLRRQ